MDDSNVLMLTYDSCRYDAMLAAHTPVLDSWSEIVKAQSPASYTYAAHMSFLVGLLPSSDEPYPLYNRFTRQLIGVGEFRGGKRNTEVCVTSDGNIVTGFADRGYQTIGCGAMNWFRQSPIRIGFDHFEFTGTDADRQISFLVDRIDPSRNFFGLINFGETHHPFTHRDKPAPHPRAHDILAANMSWPPVERGPVGREHPAFREQVEAIEFLDSRLPLLFSQLPANTIVVLCGDHGECMGEDGYYGHGINHPKVFEVPLSIFRLDGGVV
jgi:hypothetical protein